MMPMDKIITEIPYPSLPNVYRTMRGPIVPVNEIVTDFISTPRPYFPNVQSQIGSGSTILIPMKYNNTLETMRFNNTNEIMEYN